MNLKQLKDALAKSRVWVIRVTALVLALFAILSSLDITNKALLKPEYVFPAIFVLLWLALEVLLSTAGESAQIGKQPTILPWEEALPVILKSVRGATRSITIIASSTESLYLPLKESIEHCKNVKISILMRDCDRTDSLRLAKLTQYLAYWLKLRSTERHVDVDVKFYNNLFLRGIIIDSSIGLLGFYEKVDDRYWGHSVPLLYVRKGASPLSDYLLRVYLNRFSQMWSEAKNNVGQE